MDFRTEISLKPSSFKIGLKDPILAIGSCFAESIGKKFGEHAFQISINPFGTVYHPLSIHRLINYATYLEYPAEHTYLVNNDIQLNYNFHSNLRSLNSVDLKKEIKEVISSSHYFIKQCKALIITYGTAWLFERNDTGEGVANCHKMPASLFTRRLTLPEEIVSSFKEMHRSILSVNPGIKTILTVSPVRHTKDTLPLNSVSKAVLRLACHQLASELNHVEYFPAFEIMMDDLRDYRFYGPDMIHPNEVAENYIWNIFKNSFIGGNDARLMDQWGETMRRINHRVFNPLSKEHIAFLTVTISKLKELSSSFPADKYIKELENQLEEIKKYS